ncbi:MAG: hypothetical protein PVJ02_03550 [Gemmatimonadota bacterium]|jgi:hypothetical protein
MKTSIKVTALTAVFALAGCNNLLDVNNPNNLVEESIRRQSAATAVVNGAQALVAHAVSSIWQPYEVATDDFYWIGSRDAWLSIDQGFLSDPANEFTDAAFPDLAQARWMADNAVTIMEEHVAEDPSFGPELARAHLYAGIAYMVVGEVQQDFTISDKRDAGPAVGPDQMYTMLDQAITHLDAAISGTDDADIKLEAMAVRARAKQSRAIWDKIKPSPNTADPLAKSASAVSDALATIDMAGGATADWDYDFHYSSSTITNDLADWVNDRKENQVDLSLVTVDANYDISGMVIQDPIDNVADPAFRERLEKFKETSFQNIVDSGAKGGSYAPMTIASTRLMHLIVAEDALANGDDATFTEHINDIRAMDGLTPYSGQIPAMDMLQHERRVNTWLMGLRLADMYRFGITDPKWQPGSDAITAPGTLLPITLVEVRANCNLNGLGC